jgi:hypothetical protein
VQQQQQQYGMNAVRINAQSFLMSDSRRLFCFQNERLGEKQIVSEISRFAAEFRFI